MKNMAVGLTLCLMTTILGCQAEDSAPNCKYYRFDSVTGAAECVDVKRIPPGLGERCTADTDCSSYTQANYCALDPTDPSKPGICTITDCETGANDNCPPAHACCNALGLLKICLPLEIYRQKKDANTCQ